MPLNFKPFNSLLMDDHSTVTVTKLAQAVLKETIFHFITFNFYFTFSLTHTKYKPYLGYCISPDMETSLFPQGAVVAEFQWYTTVSIHLKFYAAVERTLLWFSKYLCTSSVVSIKGTWADIKASSWIIYPWQLDCTFHLKCEAELQCRNETANFLLGLQQVLTKMAILGFICKMRWNVCHFALQW